MDNTHEASEGREDSLNFTEQLEVKLNNKFAGKVIEQWADPNKGFLLQKREYPPLFPDAKSRGGIHRLYAHQDKDGLISDIGQLDFYLTDSESNTIGRIDVIRYGERDMQLLEGGIYGVREYESLTVMLPELSDTDSRYSFSDRRPDRSIYVEYDGEGKLSRIHYDETPKDEFWRGPSVRRAEMTMQDLLKIKEFELGLATQLSVPREGEGYSPVNTINQEDNLKLLIPKQDGSDDVSIPWEMDRERVLFELGLEQLLTDPMIHDVRADVWVKKSLRKTIGVEWNQSR